MNKFVKNIIKPILAFVSSFVLIELLIVNSAEAETAVTFSLIILPAEEPEKVREELPEVSEKVEKHETPATETLEPDKSSVFASLISSHKEDAIKLPDKSSAANSVFGELVELQTDTKFNSDKTFSSGTISDSEPSEFIASVPP